MQIFQKEQGNSSLNWLCSMKHTSIDVFKKEHDKKTYSYVALNMFLICDKMGP